MASCPGMGEPLALHVLTCTLPARRAPVGGKVDS